MKQYSYDPVFDVFALDPEDGVTTCAVFELAPLYEAAKESDSRSTTEIANAIVRIANKGREAVVA